MPILLVHGAVCDARIWAGLKRELKGRPEQVIAVGLPGYRPDRFHPDRFSGQKHVEALAALLDQVDGPSHLVGHSRGGRIALAAAALLPGRVRSLALVEPGGVATPGFYPEALPSPPAVMPDVVAYVRRKRHREAMQLYIDAGHGGGTWDRLPMEFRRSSEENAITILGMAGDTTAPLDRAQARRVSAPTLLVEGSLSPPQFALTLDVLAKELPHGVRRRVEGADHFLPVTAPGILAGLLSQWWDRIDGKGADASLWP